MIIIDTNSGEDVVEEALHSLGASVERRRLDVGDILIEAEGMTFCIERKKWSDLAASICDGRLKEQKSRMVSSDSVRYAYVIEGQIASWENHHRGMSCKAMHCALVKLQMRDGISVFHTLSENDTASLCIYIENQAASQGFVSGGGTSAPGISKRKRENLASPEAIFKGMLSLIPGMSISKAQAISDKFPSVPSLCSTNEDELANIQCGGRKLGPKMAKTIKSVFPNVTQRQEGTDIISVPCSST